MANSGQSNGGPQGMGGVKKAIIVIIAVLAVIILLQNTQVVTLHFLFWHLSMSQALLFPLTLLIGFVLGLLIVSLSGKKTGGRGK
ncbi:MAG: LapA family protein [candidate division Zixibacteria bacterium]|nr:LapA family protein [candidate division Zixibacteria bacterium]